MKNVLTILAILLLFAGCKTKMQYVPIESVKTEYRDRLLKDSVYIHDSTFVYKNGDSLFYWVWRTEYRDRLLKDTVNLTDTIRVPYPIEKSLSKWQQTKMDVGGWAIGAASGLLLVIIGYIVIWLVKKRI